MNTDAQNVLLHGAEAGPRESALAKIDAIDLAQYERTRNALNGRVSRLSPYLTHGITDVPEVIPRLLSRTHIVWQDKFSFELGWREYFHHVWRMQGDDIWRNQHPLPAEGQIEYASEMPTDIIAAQIRALYIIGYLHNHARMWIASYVVHIRKVDLRAGGRWIYGHLLDGDLASNTLSWQWVAGTWTGKPYLFNAENVAKYAPGYDHTGTSIDSAYERLNEIARHWTALLEAPQKRAQLPAVVPSALVTPSQIAALAREHGLEALAAPPVSPPSSLPTSPPADFGGTLLHP